MDGTLTCGGSALKEHPGDIGCRPYPSILRTPQWRRLARRHNMQTRQIDQCMIGAPSRKRTSLRVGRLAFDFANTKCTHKGRHALTLGGVDKQTGNLFTAGSEAYPSELCRRIAECILQSFDAGRLARAEEGLAPEWTGARALDRLGHARSGARACEEVWPSANGVAVPPRVARGRGPREILGASPALQALVSRPRAGLGLYGILRAGHVVGRICLRFARRGRWCAGLPRNHCRPAPLLVCKEISIGHTRDQRLVQHVVTQSCAAHRPSRGHGVVHFDGRPRAGVGGGSNQDLFYCLASYFRGSGSSWVRPFFSLKAIISSSCSGARKREMFSES